MSFASGSFSTASFSALSFLFGGAALLTPTFTKVLRPVFDFRKLLPDEVDVIAMPQQYDAIVAVPRQNDALIIQAQHTVLEVPEYDDTITIPERPSGASGL